MFLMIIAPSGKMWGNVDFPMFPEIFTCKQPVVERPTPSKSFPLRQHRYRTLLDLRLQISQHLRTGFTTLTQSTYI